MIVMAGPIAAVWLHKRVGCVPFLVAVKFGIRTSRKVILANQHPASPTEPFILLPSFSTRNTYRARWSWICACKKMTMRKAQRLQHRTAVKQPGIDRLRVHHPLGIGLPERSISSLKYFKIGSATGETGALRVSRL